MLGAVMLMSWNICFAVPGQVDWDVETWAGGSLNQAYVIGTGTVAINFNGPTDTPPGHTARLRNGTPFITTATRGGLSPSQATLQVQTNYNTSSIDQIPIIISFSHPGGVSNVSFE